MNIRTLVALIATLLIGATRMAYSRLARLIGLQEENHLQFLPREVPIVEGAQ